MAGRHETWEPQIRSLVNLHKITQHSILAINTWDPTMINGRMFGSKTRRFRVWVLKTSGDCASRLGICCKDVSPSATELYTRVRDG